MALIKIVNNEIVLGDEAMLIKPIRDMFNKDKSKNKEKFYQQLSYLYFVYDPRSYYFWIEDEKERIKEVIEQENLGADFKVSKELEKAIDLYTERFSKNVALMLLLDTSGGLNKVRTYLKNIDLNEVDDKGRPVHQLSGVVSALKQIPDLALKFQSAQETLERQLDEESKVRGGNDKISVIEDGM